MVFKSKKKAIPVPEETYDEPDEEDEIEEEEYEEEPDEPVGEPKRKLVQKKSSKNQISRQEFADMIEGSLNRALQLLQYLR